MLSKTELKLVYAPEMAKYPLISAVKGILQSCNDCHHAGMSPSSALRLAACKYRTDKDFIASVKRIAGLPAVIGGITIK